MDAPSGATTSVTLTTGAAGPFPNLEPSIQRASVDFGKLSLKFTVATAKSTGPNGEQPGRAIAWAELNRLP